MIGGVVWDLDGTIVESEPYHIKAEIETLAAYGITLTPDVAEEYLGLKTEDYFKELGKRFGKDLPMDLVLKRHSEILKRYYLRSPLVAGSKEMLSILQKRYMQGLATSAQKELAAVLLEKYSLSDYFEAMVFGDEVDRGKPNPEIFLKVAKRLDIRPRDAVVIEDAENGFKAGKAAGMLVIGRRGEHNKKQDFSLADYVAEDLEEIPDILDRIESSR